MQRNSASVRLVAASLTMASHTWVLRPACSSRASQKISPSRAVPRKLHLSFDRGEALSAVGKVRERAAAASGVGESNDRGRVEVPVGREQFGSHAKFGGEASAISTIFIPTRPGRHEFLVQIFADHARLSGSIQKSKMGGEA